MTDSERSTTQGASRRTVMGMFGLGVSTPLLAACGSDENSGGSDSSGGTDSSGGSTPSRGSTSGGDSASGGIAKTSDIPEGGGKIFEKEKVVITQPTAGDFKAFDATCTHSGCLVSKVSDEIECSCHGSRFSIEDGSPTNGPASDPLGSMTATVSGDSISVS